MSNTLIGQYQTKQTMPELRELYQGQRSLPKDEGVPKAPSVKTMLGDPTRWVGIMNRVFHRV